MLQYSRVILNLAVVALALVALPTVAHAQGTLFVKDDKVGIGVADPGPSILHLREDSGNPASFFVQTTNVAVPTDWYFQANPVTGAFLISNFFGGAAQFQVFPNQPPSTFVVRGGRVGIGTQSPGATLHVEGNIRQRSSVIHPDYVFADSYEIESIEEHSEAMWSNKHLPAVGPGEYDAAGEPYIDHGKRSQGMLEELEKAHIYIEQLHRRLQQMEERLAELESR